MTISNNSYRTIENQNSSGANIAAPYINLIRRVAGYGPQGFIKNLDEHANIKIAHKIAYRVFRHDVFEHIWSRELVVDEPELELALRWLRNDHARERAEAMIRVWWYIHDIEPCEFTLIAALDKAWDETSWFREQYMIRKEEQRAFRCAGFVLLYLEKHATASAAEIKQEVGGDRKTLNQALRRLFQSGQIDRVSRGVYRLRGDSDGLQVLLEQVEGTTPESL